MCAKRGDKGQWAAFCRSKAESSELKAGREGGRVSGKQRRSRDTSYDPKSGNWQVDQVEYDSRTEAFAFLPTACEDNIAMMKIDKTTTIMLVNSGAQSTVLGKNQFDNLVL